MSSVGGSGPSLVERLRDLLPHLGLDPEHLLVLPGEPPDHLHESHLQAWGYIPDFTPFVQYLLQLRRGGRCLSIAVCGPEVASAARAHAAVQLAVGFSQHGLRAVVVDADVGRPGLAGLVSDPHQEGLVDMVRFGRSCRALLRTPVPGGPALLGLGSFPVDGPAPFTPDTWMGIVHRVSVHAEVALFVAPLHHEGEINALAQATDQVLYVPAASAAMTERELERLRRSDARVAAVILCGPPPAAVPDQPPLRQPPAGAAFDLPEGETFPVLEPDVDKAPAALAFEVPRVELPAVTPTPAPNPVDELVLPGVPEMRLEPPPPFRVEPPGAPEVTVPRGFPPPPAWEEEPVALAASEPLTPLPEPPEPVGVGVPATAYDMEAAPERQSAARTAEEANQLRQRLRLDDADFSYSEGGRHSRLPLFMFLAVVLTIGGFLGWALWSQREVSRRAAAIRAGANEPSLDEGRLRPAPGDDQATAPSRPGARMKPDDEAAAARSVPSTVPAPTEPASPTTTGTPLEGGAAPAGNQPPGATGTQAPPPETQSPPVTQAPPSRPTPPAPVQPEAAPRAAAPEPAMTYAVHVASYRKLEQANQDIANLRKHGFEGKAVRTDLGSKGIWYRVYVGNYATREAASAARDVIVKLPGYDAFAQVRRIAVP